jgi:hypothetical protein
MYSMLCRSLNDLKEFNPKGGKNVRKDMMRKGGKKNAGANRPGKANRAKKRGGK